MNKLKLLFSYLAGHKRQVTAAVIEKDGKILIAQRLKGSTLGGRWEFPGGKIEPGETAEECLKRELKEEFDIESEVGDFFIASRFRYCLVPIELLAYRVKHLSGDFKVNEHDQIRWVSPSELNSYDFMPADKPIVKILLKNP
ncbi:MAG: 8-oxo-dGTP diphosphatase MutT [Candidatus Omnitrophica bacterium]|nr:8-oxo-dGTP diphosphatase MutT [Candidatus Omnitrophota bacterium]